MDGEIIVLSPLRMINYQGQKGDVGWIRTGDIGCFTENGLLVIKGRIKDTITLKNAKNINATLVEELVLKCDTVLEAAVKGASTDQAYDHIHVFVYSK